MAARAFDTFLVYKIISTLATPWKEQEAYQYGIIDIVNFASIQESWLSYAKRIKFISPTVRSVEIVLRGEGLTRI